MCENSLSDILDERLCLFCEFSDSFPHSFPYLASHSSHQTLLSPTEWKICSEFLELRDRPVSTRFPLLSKRKDTEEITRIKSNCNRFGVFCFSPNEKDATKTKWKRVDWAFLIDLGVIKMPSHVVFFGIVVYYCWLGDILCMLMNESVVELVCPLRETGNRWWKICFNVWVLSICPVVLISHICPPYLIIEVITIVFICILLLLFLFFDL